MSPHRASDDWAIREQRLQEIRQAAKDAHEDINTIEPLHNPASVGASAQTGYYGMPALKRPQWTVEVPIYFFVGGLAGAAALIAAVGRLSSADARLIRHSRWLAAVGGLISPALLIADLGMPSRFLNMLRVFKIQSPMSVGSWTLVAFSNSAAAAAVLAELDKRRPNSAIRVLANGAQIVSALTGLILSTYTGVLIGATAIPLWNEHVSTLPIHFAASGIASAASILELTGNESEALNRIAIGAAVVETGMGASIELRSTASTKPLRHGVSGWATRGAGLLSGPLPLALRLIASFACTSGSMKRRRNLRRAAAVSSLLGSILTRFAWVHVGRVSADDPSVPLQLTKVSAK
jgi:hypothetical protein